jgi:3-deoxy-7-phosphoheptulonate synthase
MFSRVDDVRIDSLRPLIPPAILMEELPLGEALTDQVAGTREQIGAIVDGRDDRLLVIVGPCSIHDPNAGLEYAERLMVIAEQWQEELLIVMRTYFEKPRTTVGWKGLINDPDLNGQFAINKGLRIARRFLRDVIALGLPTGTEFLDPILPQFIADLVCWGAIGARTTESQVHRELASGLSMPVGFKNGTDGDVQIVADAIRSARAQHHFLSVTKQSVAAIVATKGNTQCHAILRGGRQGPNYSETAVADAVRVLASAGLRPAVMVDCSHANSRKTPDQQVQVAGTLAERIASGDASVFGVMLESFLLEGRQDLGTGKLSYGQSITDACMGWDATVPVLQQLGEASRSRQQASSE